MRELLVWTVIVFFCLYSMKDWFAGVPLLILMMAVYGDPEMPQSIAGIQGLNPWNTLLFSTTLSYIFQKKKDNAHWDMDGFATLLFVIYFIALILSAIRLLSDQETLLFYGYRYGGTGSLISEYIINPVKFLVPAYLVFVGARTPARRKLILWSIILAHIVIGLITIRNIPLSSVGSGDALTQIGLKVLQKKFSWSKVNTAMLLGCGAWAVLFSTYFLFGNKRRYLCLMLFGLMTIALALTGGRMGYALWMIFGAYFAFTRWKKGLALLPLLTLIVLSILPSISDRILDGTGNNGDDMNTSTMTSGRTVAWPVVIDKIEQSPIFGYGGLAMIRTGAATEVSEIMQLKDGDRGFPHPHNAYLRILMDSGVVGGVPIMILWIIILLRSYNICGKMGSEEDAIGITSFCLALGLCIAALGSQNFYPLHGSIALWASIALTFRIYTDKVAHSKKL
ncbi:MAG: O-antigen ligase family protein [Psychromonas sp.]|nr:O-antigen ligase family protein [Alteromonadales bacterium]MCP5078225.1 O-antigen ligase family protein [Psychromonas sp.]